MKIPQQWQGGRSWGHPFVSSPDLQDPVEAIQDYHRHCHVGNGIVKDCCAQNVEFFVGLCHDQIQNRVRVKVSEV